MLIVGYGVTDLNSRTRSEILSDAERMSGFVTYKDMMEYKIETLQISNLDNAFYAAGDSGGPLFHQEPDVDEVMVGLGSCFDPACKSLKGLFYRLDTESALSWIDDNLPDDR